LNYTPVLQVYNRILKVQIKLRHKTAYNGLIKRFIVYELRSNFRARKEQEMRYRWTDVIKVIIARSNHCSDWCII